MFDVQDGHGDYFLLIEKTSFSSKYGGPLLLLVIGGFPSPPNNRVNAVKGEYSVSFSHHLLWCVCVCVCVCVCGLDMVIEGRKNMFYLMFGNVLFNNALNTFYLRLYGALDIW